MPKPDLSPQDQTGQSTRSESPSVIASQLGLLRSNPGSGGRMVTWDQLVDLAAKAYWERRDQQRKSA